MSPTMSVRVSNLSEISLFSWLRAKRGINFQEDIAVVFKKSQSSFPTDLHLAVAESPFQQAAAGLKRRQPVTKQVLANLVPPLVDPVVER